MPTRATSAAESSALRRVCAWCSRVMREGPPAPVSHGICVECAARTGVFPIENLHRLDARALDALPWGTVVLDDEGVVLEYNAAEEKLAGTSRRDAMGRSFFREVAPCTSVREFGGRFAEMVASRSTGPEHFEFVFRFPSAQLLVEIGMSYAPELHRGTLLIQATE